MSQNDLSPYHPPIVDPDPTVTEPGAGVNGDRFYHLAVGGVVTRLGPLRQLSPAQAATLLWVLMEQLDDLYGLLRKAASAGSGAPDPPAYVGPGVVLVWHHPPGDANTMRAWVLEPIGWRWEVVGEEPPSMKYHQPDHVEALFQDQPQIAYPVLEAVFKQLNVLLGRAQQLHKTNPGKAFLVRRLVETFNRLANAFGAIPPANRLSPD